VETLGSLLDRLPADAIPAPRLQPVGGADINRLVRRVAAALERRSARPNAVLEATTVEILRAAKTTAPSIARAMVADPASTPMPNDLDSWLPEEPSYLAVTFDHLFSEGTATPFNLQLAATAAQAGWHAGVLVQLNGDPDRVSERLRIVEALDFVMAVTIPSTIHSANAVRTLRELESASFEGEVENPGRFHFGYAKANRFAHVYQHDGVHVQIRPYTGPPPIDAPRTGDRLEDRLQALEEAAWDAASEWPFYSGGGFGTAFGVEGNFVAEVDFEMETTSQATMCEMAITNVDPSRHMPGWRLDESGAPMKDARGNRIANTPQSFRDKSSFFNPHGAPPFVGAEHDEDDGYRINYNLGVEYDNNHYGRPVGNGATHKGRFRLERRGPYFSAYYMDTENADWVCSGVCRNDSMNDVVFIRCAGKRWRQETSPPVPGQPWLPVVPNHFVFRNFSVWTVLDEGGRKIVDKPPADEHG